MVVDEGDSGGGAAPDAGLETALTHCTAVESTSLEGEDSTNNSVQLPVDFSVSRVEIGFTEGCEDPLVELTLSDGRCSTTPSHLLRFQFSADKIEDGALFPGQHEVADLAATSLSILYERPDELASAGRFGTCSVATGVLVLEEAPTVEAGGNFVGSYQLTLRACAGTSASPQDLQGTFQATLRSSLSDRCQQDGVDAGSPLGGDE